MRIAIAVVAATAAALSSPAFAAPPSTPAAAADPAQQALAARVAAALWPDGSYGRMVDAMLGGDQDGFGEMFLDMRPGDLMGALAESMPEEKAATAKAKTAESSPTFREMMKAEDPHFEERMRIMARVVGEEVRRIAKPIEPKFRAGLAKSIARRFTRAQLEPLAAFLETDAGRAYAAQSMTMFMDKDVMLAMANSLPVVIKELPGAFKKVEAATAHLPKPPKKSIVGTEQAPEDEDEAEGESEDEDEDETDKNGSKDD